MSGECMVSADTRPLHARVAELARRYDAMAIGADKRADASRQDADNYRRDANTLHSAAEAIKLWVPQT